MTEVSALAGLVAVPEPDAKSELVAMAEQNEVERGGDRLSTVGRSGHRDCPKLEDRPQSTQKSTKVACRANSVRTAR